MPWNAQPMDHSEYNYVNPDIFTIIDPIIYPSAKSMFVKHYNFHTHTIFLGNKIIFKFNVF